MSGTAGRGAAANVRIAVIGDFGTNSKGAASVAALVHGLHPDFIVTVGDNNYPVGSAETIDTYIGKYYHDFVAPYAGRYGAGAATKRFFPALGNYDWATVGLRSYLTSSTRLGSEASDPMSSHSSAPRSSSC